MWFFNNDNTKYLKLEKEYLDLENKYNELKYRLLLKVNQPNEVLIKSKDDTWFMEDINKLCELNNIEITYIEYFFCKPWQKTKFVFSIDNEIVYETYIERSVDYYECYCKLIEILKNKNN